MASLLAIPAAHAATIAAYRFDNDDLVATSVASGMTADDLATPNINNTFTFNDNDGGRRLDVGEPGLRRNGYSRYRRRAVYYFRCAGYRDEHPQHRFHFLRSFPHQLRTKSHRTVCQLQWRLLLKNRGKCQQ